MKALAAAFAAALLAAGCSCQSTGTDGHGDAAADVSDEADGADSPDHVDVTDAADSHGDPPIDPPADTWDATFDPWGDLPDVLAAESDAWLYEAPGEYPIGTEPTLSEFSNFPAAFSGTAYMIPMTVNIPEGSWSYYYLGAFHMDPADLWIEPSWMSAAMEWDTQPATASACWSGEAFIVAFPMEGVGIWLLSFDGEGDPIQPLATIGTDLAYDPAPDTGQMPASVFCTSDGPFLVDPGRVGGWADRIHHLAADGSIEGTTVDVDLPPLQVNTFYGFPGRCLTMGAEVACLVGEGDPLHPQFSIALLDRSGTVRFVPAWSDPFALGWAGGIIAFSGYDLLDVNGDIGIVFNALDVKTGQNAYHYGVVGTDGSFVVRASSTGIGELGFHNQPVAVASEDHVVLAHTDWAGGASITLFLLDLTGEVSSSPLSVSTLSDTHGGSDFFPGLFWEGDAFAALWTREHLLAYQRFVVLE